MPISKERISELSGKRVHVETTDFHHVSGIVKDRRAEFLVLDVQGKEVSVRVDAISSLEEAGPHEAEYVK